MKRVILLLAMVTALTFPAITSAQGPLRAAVRVDGLSCPFCAYGLEKKIKTMDGVNNLSIDIEKGRVDVLFRDKKFFDRKRLEAAVRDAGFTARKIEVETSDAKK